MFHILSIQKSNLTRQMESQENYRMEIQAIKTKIIKKT